MNGIAILSSSEEFEHRVHDAYGVTSNGHMRHWREGLQVGDIPGFVEEIIESDPRVLVVGPGLYDHAALRFIEEVDARRPDIVTVMVAEASPELWPTVVRAGARDVIAPDTGATDLRERLDRALSTADLRRGQLRTTVEPAPRAQVISVVSPKGGAGKTTVATNLAVGLATLAPGEVVILDLDLQFGGVAGAFQLTPEHSIADAAAAGSALDAAMLKVFLTPRGHELFALCAPESLAQADEIGPEALSRIVSLLKQEFRFVVIDTAAGIDVATLAAIECSTDLVLVSTTDVSCVRALRRAMDALDQLGLNAQVRHFALNRADLRDGLSIEDVQAFAGEDVDVAIPDSRAVALGLNVGIPIVESEPKSTAGKALLELAGPFARKSAETVESPGGRGGRRVQRRKRERQ